MGKREYLTLAISVPPMPKSKDRFAIATVAIMS